MDFLHLTDELAEYDRRYMVKNGRTKEGKNRDVLPITCIYVEETDDELVFCFPKGSRFSLTNELKRIARLFGLRLSMRKIDF